MMENFEFSHGPRKNFTQRIAVTTTGAATALEANIVGAGKVRVKAVGAEVQFYFGGGSDSVVQDATGAGDTVGYTLLAGESEDFYIGSQTHIVWDASGAGFIVLLRAGKERTGR
jgi:hypothetical protein